MTWIAPAFALSYRNIDADLRAVLETLAHDITSQPVIVCGNVTGIFIVRFDVPSGKVYHVEGGRRMNSGQ